MKVYFLFNFLEKSGGGNQFLKALKNYFILNNLYSENPENADIILFNSYQFEKELIKLKLKFQNKIFIHRVDGPIKLYNTENDKRDEIVSVLNKYISDATIFQSKWSRKKNIELGIIGNSIEKIIYNAPDSSFFNTNHRKKINQDKIKIIATSWSKNLKKGFKDYKWLDENLDFNKYQFHFIGNSPYEFKNIIHFKAMKSIDLAKQLKNSDIYITSSQNDPCSNSLIEALSCGLPVIYLDQGGHPELVKKAGIGYKIVYEVPSLLAKITENYEYYKNQIDLQTIKTTGEEYYNFFKNLKSKHIQPKKLKIISLIRISIVLIPLKLKDFFNI